MRHRLTDSLRCPTCHAERSLALQAEASDGQEVREGELRCAGCGRSFEVAEGIAELLRDPPDFIAREAAGLGRFAELMRAEGWDREKIRSLPHIDDPYWYGQRVSFDQLVALVDLQPGQSLLDVGSNTCWASNLFAQRGLDVIALDITKTEMQGLRTAEYFIDSGEVYFERVVSNMADPAIASNSLDYVFCCEVLHHNGLKALGKTLTEIYRILKPGGKLLVLNEPMRFPLNRKHDHAVEVAQFEGNENVHYFHQYFLGARRAGFSVRILPPPYLPFFSGQPDALPVDYPVPRIPRWLARHCARRVRILRRAYLAWLMLITGDLSLSLICQKGVDASRVV